MPDAGPPEQLCRVTFLPSGRQIDVPCGTTLFDATRQAKLPLASSCDGEVICGKCRVEVVSGAEHLSPIGASEQRLLTRLRAEPTDRIACDARIGGEVTITTGYW